MVWVMSGPSGFGEFWPDGKPEGTDDRSHDGWRMRLTAHYASQTTEGKRHLFDVDPIVGQNQYAFFVGEKFNFEIGTEGRIVNSVLTPVKPHEPPSYYRVHRTPSSIGSLISLSLCSLAVDQRLKEIIESLEPGVHDFFPIELRMSQKKTYPLQYYTLVVGQYIDSFSPKNTEKRALLQWKGHNLYNYENSKKGMTGLAFCKHKFKSAHLWRERRFTKPLYCLSDELLSKIDETGLRIPKHYKAREV